MPSALLPGGKSWFFLVPPSILSERILFQVVSCFACAHACPLFSPVLQGLCSICSQLEVKSEGRREWTGVGQAALQDQDIWLCIDGGSPLRPLNNQRTSHLPYGLRLHLYRCTMQMPTFPGAELKVRTQPFEGSLCPCLEHFCHPWELCIHIKAFAVAKSPPPP